MKKRKHSEDDEDVDVDPIQKMLDNAEAMGISQLDSSR